MKISVQSAPWFSYDDPNAGFAMIKACGFDAVDFNIDHLLSPRALAKSGGPLVSFFDKSDEEILEFFRPVKEAAEKNGISFAQMHAPFPTYIPDRDDVTAYAVAATEKCLMVCDYVGCPAIVVHPYTLYAAPTKEKEHEINLGIYRALIPAAKKYKVKVCLENLFTGFNERRFQGACASAEEAVWYIDKLNEEAGEDCFGFCFDIGHANIVGVNIRQYLNTLGKRLTILHLHDNDGHYDTHTLPYACLTGAKLTCDWEGFMAGLKDIGYEGALNFETFRALGAFPKEVWPETLRLISAIGRMFDNRIHS